jgi:hypothetical protein
MQAGKGAETPCPHAILKPHLLSLAASQRGLARRGPCCASRDPRRVSGVELVGGMQSRLQVLGCFAATLRGLADPSRAAPGTATVKSAVPSPAQSPQLRPALRARGPQGARGPRRNTAFSITCDASLQDFLSIGGWTPRAGHEPTLSSRPPAGAKAARPC